MSSTNLSSSPVVKTCSSCLHQGCASSKPRWIYSENDGQPMYINTVTSQKWIPTVDNQGKTYYYELNSHDSVWELDDFDLDSVVHEEESCQYSSALGMSISEPFHASKADLDGHGSGDNSKVKSVEKETTASMSSLLTSACNISQESLLRTKQKKNVRAQSEYVCSNRDSSLSLTAPSNNGKKYCISGPKENRLISFERKGIVTRSTIMENGKPVAKKWSSCYLVLNNSYCMMYKDPKSAMPKSNNPYGKPDLQINVQEIEISDFEDECLLKNVLKISYTQSGKEFAHLIQMQANVYESWKMAFKYARELLNDDERGRCLSRPYKNRDQMNVGLLDKSILAKLLTFFRNRPSAASLRSQGILKNEPVFGSTIIQVCEQEQSDAPNFIVCAIRAIENRGLEMLGIYRRCGNGAIIQKLRCEVNENIYSLNSDRWSVEVLTGGLRLFFRELKEPLFTYKIYPQVASLMTQSNLPTDKLIQSLKDQIDSMPQVHINTARILFHHLYRVNELSHLNQMHAQNLAIIFGPNLLWPEVEGSIFSTLMTVQAPFIECVISHTEELFGPICPPPVIS